MTREEFNAVADRYVLGVVSLEREAQAELLEYHETEQCEAILAAEQFDDDEEGRALFLRFTKTLFARVRHRLAEINEGGNA